MSDRNVLHVFELIEQKQNELRELHMKEVQELRNEIARLNKEIKIREKTKCLNRTLHVL
jgi:hypothetical protein